MGRARLSILGTSLLIAACGGGGDQFGNNDPVAETFEITATNGLLAARVAWESAVASGELTDLGGSLPVTATVQAGVSKPAAARPTGLAMSVVQAIPFGPFVIDCIPSGTVSYSGDTADPLMQTLTVNDTFSVVYTMCDEGAGEVLDGQIDFTVREFSGDLLGGIYMLGVDAVVTNLQVITATDTLLNNGDVSVTLDTLNSPFVTAGTSGTSMTTDTNSSSETIMNYQSNQTVDGNLQNLPYTLFASGMIDTTQLAGNVRYSTPVEFSGAGTDYPSAGELLVEGSNSSARLTAIDNVNVMIELDVNGDGIADETINTTWVELTT